MKHWKKYTIISVIVLIVAFMLNKVTEVDKKIEEEISVSNTVTEVPNQADPEKMQVSGYHLVTYNQSANENSFINSINVQVENGGKVKFVVGSIDENNFIQERKSFEVECKNGENTINLLDDRIIVKKGEYLFMDILEQNVLYKQAGSIGKSLVQSEITKKSGRMLVIESDYILPFKYTLEKVNEYNVLVIGNDVTTKDGGAGQAATRKTKDYYYLTAARLYDVFEEVNIGRVNAKNWEKEPQTRTAWLDENLPENYVQNLDLVIFQLGDNLATLENFESDMLQLISRVKNYSENAEMIWIGPWNENKELQNSLPGICEKLNIDFININDLNVADYQTVVKEQVEKKVSENTVTNTEAENVTNTVQTTKLAEIDVSYPNNEAMQLISNRIMEVLGFGVY